METGVLWREEVQSLETRYKKIELEHMLADNYYATFEKPKTIDVILADNLFGDMLSDEAAPLGLLPSAFS